MRRALPALLLLGACGPDEATLQRVAQLEARQALMRDQTTELAERLDTLDGKLEPVPEREVLVPGFLPVGPTRTLLARETMLQLSQSDIDQSFRARPYTRDDELVGYRVYAIRKRGVPAAAGLRNGDLALRLNGRPLTEWDKPIDAVALLTSGNDFELDIRRRGVEITLELRIVDVLPEPE